jgi:FMN-dependent NADH-azoreductase
MMTRLLHLSASPRGKDSESLALAQAFLDEVALSRPEVEVDSWDL